MSNVSESPQKTEYVCRWCGESSQYMGSAGPAEIVAGHRFCQSAVVLDMEPLRTPEALLEGAELSELLLRP